MKVKREDDINTPVSWCCVDCGVNTAPGMSTRAEIYKALYVDKKEGIEQTITADTEIYTVRSKVWKKAGMGPDGGCLCIGCLEKRLGRQLTPEDFKRSHAFNRPGIPGTVRLTARRNGVPEIEIARLRTEVDNNEDEDCLLKF